MRPIPCRRPNGKRVVFDLNKWRRVRRNRAYFLAKGNARPIVGLGGPRDVAFGNEQLPAVGRVDAEGRGAGIVQLNASNLRDLRTALDKVSVNCANGFPALDDNG